MEILTSEQIMDMYCEIVSKYTMVSISDMKRDTRKTEVVLSRQIAMYMMAKYIPRRLISLQKCGNYFGRDHATVIHARRVISNIIEQKSKYRSYQKYAFLDALDENLKYILQVDNLKKLEGYFIELTKNIFLSVPDKEIEMLTKFLVYADKDIHNIVWDYQAAYQYCLRYIGDDFQSQKTEGKID